MTVVARNAYVTIQSATDQRHGLPAASRTVLVCAAMHLLFGVIILARLLPVLHAAIASSNPSLYMAAMEPGLRRLLVADVLIPPLAPVAAVAILTMLIPPRSSRRSEAYAWLALGLIPFPVEQFGRAVLVLASGESGGAGEVFALASRFTTGPLLLFGFDPPVWLGPAITHWLRACSLAAAVAIYCWSRAHEVARLRRRASNTLAQRDGLLGLEGAAVALGCYLAATLITQLLTTPAAQLLLLTAR